MFTPTETAPLVERLRTDVLWHQRRGNDTIAKDCQEAADEIDRLYKLLAEQDSAIRALRSELAAERERCLNEWNGLLLELRQMADDSADRGDVFAQRVVALLSRA